MNSEIKNEIDNFILRIKTSEIYRNYLNVLNQINNSKEINDLINEIKNIEKELVVKPNIVLEETLKSKEELLNSIPLYLDYKESVYEVNNLLKIIKNRFDIFIEDITL